MRLFVDSTQPLAVRESAEQRIRTLLDGRPDVDDLLVSATRLKSGRWSIYLARLGPPVPEILPTLADMSFPQLAAEIESALDGI